jgi:hypothetical protein
MLAKGDAAVKKPPDPDLLAIMTRGALSFQLATSDTALDRTTSLIASELERNQNLN